MKLKKQFKTVALSFGHRIDDCRLAAWYKNLGMVKDISTKIVKANDCPCISFPDLTEIDSMEGDKRPHKNVTLVMGRPVFGVYDHDRLKPTCSATATSYRLEISDLEIRINILSRQRKQRR